MHTPRVLIAVALAASLPTVGALAQTGKLLLGVPFGEKLDLRQCPSNTDKANAPCWIEKPFLYKPTGSRLGHIHLPNPSTRPEWASYAMFQIDLDKDNRVQELKVTTFDSKDRIQVGESISLRFGKPLENELRRSDASWASWRSSEGYVDMRCVDKCWIEFRTPTAQAAREAEMAERNRMNASRPKAP
mgnify:FL=1